MTDFPSIPSNGSSPAAAACPTLMQLAAYCDQRLEADEVDAVDLHLARCGECLDLVRDLQQNTGEDELALAFVPSHLMERAMAMVEQAVPLRSPARTWMIVGRRAAAIAATIAIGAAGYEVGSKLTPASQAIAATDDDFSFGLLDTAGWDRSDADFFLFETTDEEASS